MFSPDSCTHLIKNMSVRAASRGSCRLPPSQKALQIYCVSSLLSWKVIKWIIGPLLNDCRPTRKLKFSWRCRMLKHGLGGIKSALHAFFHESKGLYWYFLGHHESQKLSEKRTPQSCCIYEILEDGSSIAINHLERYQLLWCPKIKIAAVGVNIANCLRRETTTPEFVRVRWQDVNVSEFNCIFILSANSSSVKVEPFFMMKCCTSDPRSKSNLLLFASYQVKRGISTNYQQVCYLDIILVLLCVYNVLKQTSCEQLCFLHLVSNLFLVHVATHSLDV